jgi:hypothetical protein
MIDTLIATFAELLSTKFVTMNKEDSTYWQGITVKNGGKYAKLINNAGGQSTVYAFIDRNSGEIYKAASYKLPAKGVRAILSETTINDLVSVADPYTSWLYRR